MDRREDSRVSAIKLGGKCEMESEEGRAKRTAEVRKEGERKRKEGYRGQVLYSVRGDWFVSLREG